MGKKRRRKVKKTKSCFICGANDHLQSACPLNAPTAASQQTNTTAEKPSESIRRTVTRPGPKHNATSFTPRDVLLVSSSTISCRFCQLPPEPNSGFFCCERCGVTVCNFCARGHDGNGSAGDFAGTRVCGACLTSMTRSLTNAVENDDVVSVEFNIQTWKLHLGLYCIHDTQSVSIHFTDT